MGGTLPSSDDPDRRDNEEVGWDTESRVGLEVLSPCATRILEKSLYHLKVATSKLENRVG